MKAVRYVILFGLLACTKVSTGQQVVDSVKFFADENPLNVTLTTDMRKLLNERMKGDYLPAIFTSKLPDSSMVSEQIRINARGVYRRSNCYMPPIRLTFKNATSPRLSPLKTLKLVCACKPSNNYEQLLLKEYLIYKIYNLLTPKSFLVRLLRTTYQDSKIKKKPFTQYAFLIESVAAMAKRNHCKEWKQGIKRYDLLDRDQMTMVAVFQYMIGNTDWGITNNHNLKLIYSKKDSAAKPYAIPYDYDYCGLVNADYAVPNPELGLDNVVQRLYRGYTRTMNELQAVFQVFNQQKEKIYALIKGFELLDSRNKKEMIAYLDDFYRTINKQSDAEFIFIRNARQQ